jgi:hypothetical protein
MSRVPYADRSRETFNAAMDICEHIAVDLFAPPQLDLLESIDTMTLAMQDAWF